MTRTDNKITLVNIKFPMEAQKNLDKNELDNLSDTTHDFFILFNHLKTSSKYVDFANLWLVQNPIQDLDTVTCGIFQIYFYINLFNPDVKSKIQKKKKSLTNTTLEILLIADFRQVNKIKK